MTAERKALDGLRVVDFGHYLAAPLTAMLLGDLGADVIRVDSPGGPRWRHPANAVLQRGKRSIVLDLAAASDRTIARRILEHADVAVESFRPGVADRLGIGADEAQAANPRLVYCSIPGFPAGHPLAHVRAWDGVLAAAGGLFRNVPGTQDDPQYVAHPLTSSVAAMIACHSIAAALIARERTGAGQRIETSLFDAAFEVFGHEGQKILHAPPAPPPPDPSRAPQIGHYRGSDGVWIQLCLIQPRHLEWFGRTFFPQEWIDDGMLDPARLMTDPELAARARARLADLIATRPAAEWEREINERSGAGAAVTQTSESWLRGDRGARESRAVITLEDPYDGPTEQAGYPISLSLTPPEARGPRRVLGADRAEILAELDALDASPRPSRERAAENIQAPLEGITALDLSTVLAGPTAMRVLAEYGAKVIKINAPDDDQLGMHQHTNAGKQTILLNLKEPEGRQLFYELLEDADVVHANFARGVAERLGIGEDAIRERRPNIIYSQISAFGETGFRAAWRGREELGQALTGMQIRYGGPDDPRMIFMAVNDFGSGHYSAFAGLVALYHRMRTGEGQRTHASLAQTATFHQVPYMVAYDGRVWDEPQGFGAKGWGPYDRLYRATDRWFYLAALAEEERAALRMLSGLSTVDFSAGEGLEARIADAFSARAADDWVALLTAAGVPAHTVLTPDEVMERPEARERGLSVVRSLPDGKQIRTIGPPARLSRTPARIGVLVKEPGGDGRAVLGGVGRAKDFDTLVARGVMAAELPPGIDMIGRFQAQPLQGRGGRARRPERPTASKEEQS
ncbi:MAG TPA: CoA transferase [Baekduia sp.]|nr:CoA transferase [Baekduia sp.]